MTPGPQDKAVGTTLVVQACLDRLQQGDESARRELIDFTYQRLRRLVVKMRRDFPRVGRWEMTDDVLHESLLKLERAMRDVSVTSPQAFFALAALQIRRVLLDMVRRHNGPMGHGARHHSGAAGEGRGPALADQPDDAPQPDELAQWREMHEAIDSLPDDEREVFDLIYFGGLPQVEVAELLDVSARTVKRRWRSARLILGSRLKS